MKIVVEDSAYQWFCQEYGVQPNEFVRFYVRYGGSSPVNTSYSLAISMEPPKEIGIQTVVEGVTFYIETDDLWYLKEHNLRVTVDLNGELAYKYE
ncbi:HesB/YadR/YfhF family protein [Hazenella coriacea]|uniref:Uncharacterized protein YneR n=1 Tax=Hazenella coriacea TaxID=1179467 RepID=A0A4R3L4J8_9BACL|nr:hypothetical protein [Hazenella coriacea]TCS93660.1 uncharacterized protein YneR [Hazenella coriacea]